MSAVAAPAKTQQAIPLAVRQHVYRVLADEFEFGVPIPMATVAFALMDAGVDKEAFGYKKLKPFLAELDDFLSFTDIIANGVPQRLVTVNKRDDWSVEPVGEKHVPPCTEGGTGCACATDANDPVASLMAAMARSVEYREGPVPQGIMDELRPELSSFCYLPTPTLDILRQNVPEGVDVYALLEADWACAYRCGALRYYEGKVVFPLHEMRSDGRTPIEISMRHVTGESAEGKPWFVCYVNTYVRPERAVTELIPSRELELFARLGPWDQFLSELADCALPESWDFEPAPGEVPPRHRNAILKSYICTTFYRLKLEDKVCVDDEGTFAAFNTGLVTPTYDDIYACFEPSQATGGPAWKFVRFCTGGTGTLGKRLVSSFNPLPEPASYFERMEDLLFDLEKDLIIDFDHVLADNMGRLPVAFLEDELRGNKAAVNLLRRACKAEGLPRKAAFKELGELVRGDARLFRRLRRCIDDAVDVACKRVRWNFKTAIPCYYPRANSMSLLLPLCLVSDDVADLALVVQLMPSGNYQGQTVLTMRQAYMNARLICRPDSEWLTTAGLAADEDDGE